MLINSGNGKEVLQTIYKKHSLSQDYQSELDALIYSGMGRIV
jgi:hypothetical protein